MARILVLGGTDLANAFVIDLRQSGVGRYQSLLLGFSLALTVLAFLLRFSDLGTLPRNELATGYHFLAPGVDSLECGCHACRCSATETEC